MAPIKIMETNEFGRQQKDFLYARELHFIIITYYALLSPSSSEYCKRKKSAYTHKSNNNGKKNCIKREFHFSGIKFMLYVMMTHK